MQIEKNLQFRLLCLIERKDGSTMQFDILQNALECDILPNEVSDCYGKNILQCLEVEENGNVEKFLSVVSYPESIQRLVQCVIIE